MASKKEMSPQAAMFTLRAMEGFLSISMRSRNSEGETSDVLNMFVSEMHEAIDMACTALALMGDNSVEIEEGGSNDGRGKTDSGDN